MNRRNVAFDLPDIAADLFAAAADPAGWPAAFGRVAEAVHGESEKLYLEISGGAGLTVLAAPAYDPEALRLYSEHYVHDDPWRRAAAHIDQLPATLGHAVVDPAAFERSPLWNELGIKHGKAFHLIIASMPLADGLSGKLGIHRPRHAEPFGSDEQLRLSLLLPFLQRALKLGVRLGQRSARDRLGHEALMALDRPAIVVDADARVMLANPAAEAAARGGAIRLGGPTAASPARGPTTRRVCTARSGTSARAARARRSSPGRGRGARASRSSSRRFRPRPRACPHGQAVGPARC